MTQQLTSSPRKMLDEASFQELLAAAHVVQKHNELSATSDSNYPDVIAEVLRIQKIIRSGHSNLLATAKLICEQVQRFTPANGAALGIVVDDELTYLAAIGNASRDMGLRTALDGSLPASSLRSGVTLKCLSTEQDPRIIAALRNRPDIRSFIAVPVEFENKVVGVLEARFATPDVFRDDDVQVCEFLAELVNELIIRAGHGGFSPVGKPSDAHEERRTDVATEKASGPGVPENGSSKNSDIIPTPLTVTVPIETQAIALSELKPARPEPMPSTDTVICRGCGEELTGSKLFCGKCGTERTSKPDGPLQKKWASMWFMNQAQNRVETDEDLEEPLEQEAINDPIEAKPLALKPAQEVAAIEVANADVTEEAQPAKAVRLEWLPSAITSENWLRHQWRVNRANFYLAGAAFLLIMVLSGVGTTPDVFAPTNPNRPKLTLFESMLVSLGLAEPPAAPVYQGNPNTPVWVDTHTALYYCPGSDLYGKTEGGKIATQRDAQLDQFEPAHRRACN